MCLGFLTILLFSIAGTKPNCEDIVIITKYECYDMGGACVPWNIDSDSTNCPEGFSESNYFCPIGSHVKVCCLKNSAK